MRLRSGSWLLAIALALVGCRRAGLQPLDTPPPGTRPLPHVEAPAYVLPASARAALDGPVGIVPSIAIVEGHAGAYTIDPVPFRINDFPDAALTCMGDSLTPVVADYLRICPIHPYTLVSGQNVATLGRESVTWAVTRWDYLRVDRSQEIARWQGRTRGSFEWRADLPLWSWTSAPLIESTDSATESLHAEVMRFVAELTAIAEGEDVRRADAFFAAVRHDTAEFIQASELRGKPFTFLELLRDALEGRALPGRPSDSVYLVTRTPAAYHMEVFAGGRLARIVFRDRDPPIVFDSKYDDGSWGSQGRRIITADLWYRRGADGNWKLDAVVPVNAPGVAEQYDAAPSDAIELFRYSAF